jgi:hydroxymethylbilane synthase
LNAAPLRIATRSSPLALWQANRIAELLRKADPNRNVTIVHVTTSGDRDRESSLSTAAIHGVFTREVQAAVLDRRTDLAVHSLKDLPTEPVEGLVLAAVPERASPFDALVLPLPNPIQPSLSAVENVGRPLDALARGARVGTGSLRRRAQLLHLRPDLVMLDVRGNVETRIAKLDAGNYDALVLADAGLRRLGRDSRISTLLQPPALFWAVGQGALGVECRSDDEPLRALLSRINNPDASQAVTAERALLAELRAGCQAPLGVSTRIDGREIDFEAVVLSRDGRERIHAAARGPIQTPHEVAAQVAKTLLAQGALRLVAEARQP